MTHRVPHVAPLVFLRPLRNKLVDFASDIAILVRIIRLPGWESNRAPRRGSTPVSCLEHLTEATPSEQVL